ncbi:hypothetical protein [Streptomyces sp. HD]|uniref:hypothetical protein n=1 Tax=Streptomyces sp. HD TaxID=3020892 RepID=UPI00232C7002|nr:hypothetical protein [Streptomyces sp. HD]MDC0766731.1 hypothetical protein [Streptomyces sp. HD]
MSDAAVGLFHDAPDGVGGVGGAAEAEVGQRGVEPGGCLLARVQQRRYGETVGAERGHAPAAVAVDHRHDAVDEVAEPSGEVRVGAGDEPVGCEVGVPGLELVMAVCPHFEVHREPVGKRVVAAVMLTGDAIGDVACRPA